jgi:hypothetical protein
MSAKSGRLNFPRSIPISSIIFFMKRPDPPVQESPSACAALLLFWLRVFLALRYRTFGTVLLRHRSGAGIGVYSTALSTATYVGTFHSVILGCTSWERQEGVGYCIGVVYEV